MFCSSPSVIPTHTPGTDGPSRATHLCVSLVAHSASYFSVDAYDLLLDRRGTAFVEKIKLKAITRAAAVLALIALLPSFGLAAFDDMVAMTMGTQHGDEYHDALLLKPSAAWHTCG